MKAWACQCLTSIKVKGKQASSNPEMGTNMKIDNVLTAHTASARDIDR